MFFVGSFAVSSSFSAQTGINAFLINAFGYGSNINRCTPTCGRGHARKGCWKACEGATREAGWRSARMTLLITRGRAITTSHADMHTNRTGDETGVFVCDKNKQRQRRGNDR